MLGVVLIVLLILSGIFVYYLVKVMVKLKQISVKAEQAASNIQVASLLFKKSVAPRTISRLLGSVLVGLRSDVGGRRVIKQTKYDFDLAEEQLKALHRELSKFIVDAETVIHKNRFTLKSEWVNTISDSKILISEVRTLLSDLHDGLVHAPAIQQTLKSGQQLKRRLNRMRMK